MRMRSSLRLAAVGASLSLCSAFGPATATAAVRPAGFPIGVGGFPILHSITAQNQAHVCKVIGKDKYGNQAVLCVNLTAVTTGDLTSALPYAAVAQVVASCQNSSNVTVQCANITEKVELDEAADDDPLSVSNKCGHASGACAVAGLSAQTDNPRLTYTSISDTCGEVPVSVYDAWAFAVGGGPTVIELPTSDMNVTLDSSNANDGNNFSTGHNYVCY